MYLTPFSAFKREAVRLLKAGDRPAAVVCAMVVTGVAGPAIV